MTTTFNRSDIVGTVFPCNSANGMLYHYPGAYREKRKRKVTSTMWYLLFHLTKIWWYIIGYLHETIAFSVYLLGRLNICDV